MSNEASQQKPADIVAEQLNADVLLFAGGMFYGSDSSFYTQLSEIERRENLFMIVCTYGGAPAVGYRIGRFVRLLYPKGRLHLVIPLVCMSAGSLLAIASDQLIMTDLGQLGPIDIQVPSREEVGEFGSGLTTLKALDALREEALNVISDVFDKLRSEFSVSTRHAMEVAANMSIGLMRPLYEQLDPQRLAENQRAVSIMSDYAERLKRRNVKDGAISRLVGSYPTHDFVIDRQEAQELFNDVRQPSRQELVVLSEILGTIVESLSRSYAKKEPALVQLLSTHIMSVEGNHNEQSATKPQRQGSGGAQEDIAPGGGSDERSEALQTQGSRGEDPLVGAHREPKGSPHE